jgi:hypothetical protein
MAAVATTVPASAQLLVAATAHTPSRLTGLV